MTVTRWTTARLFGLAGLIIACGCATTGTPPQTAGLTAQQLMNVGQPPQKSSWMAKLPFGQSAKPAASRPASRPSLAERSSAPTSLERGEVKKGDMMAMARLNERRGQMDMAKKLYALELEKNPHSALIHHRLGVIAAREENWEQANKHFQTAQELAPDNAELLSDVGYALYLQHKLDAAEATLRRAVAINPRHLAAHNNLGIVLGVQGKFDESFAEFKRAGSAAEAHANLAYVYAQLGDVDNAMTNLNQALSLDGNLKTAAIALLQLDSLKKRFEPAPKAEEMLVLDDAKSAPDANAGALATLDRQVEKARQTPPGKTAEQVAESTPGSKAFDSAVVPPQTAQTAAPPHGAAPFSAAVAGRPSLPPASSASAVPPTESGPQQLAATIGQPASVPEAKLPAAQLPAAKAHEAPAVAAVTPVAIPSKPVKIVVPASASLAMADVISPSARMQEIRAQERRDEAAKVSELAGPAVKLLPDTKPLAQAANAPPTGQSAVSSAVPIASSAASAASSSRRVRPAESAEPSNAPPAAQDLLAANPGFSVRPPSMPIPRSEDLMPRDALLQQAPTHQLHPAAQTTWSASAQSLRFLTDRGGQDAAHYFPGVTAAQPQGAKKNPLAAEWESQLADRSQFEALRLPMRY